MVQNIDEQRVEVKQFTCKDGLDKSHSADNDKSITDNTVYIAGTHSGRASDWYDDILKSAITMECRSKSQSIQILHVVYEKPSHIQAI